MKRVAGRSMNRSSSGITICSKGRPPGPACALRLETPGGSVAEFHRTFADGRGAGPFLLINSAGYLEIALWGARADAALGLSLDSRPVLTPGV